MEIMYFKKCILDKKLPNLSILTGDQALISIYKEQIYQNFKIKRLNSFEDYLNIITSKVNFNKDVTYIIYNDETFQNNSNLWTNKIDNIIFIYDKLLKTSKFYKAFEPNIINFPKIDDSLLTGLIKNRVDIKDEDIEWIIKECRHDYFKCLNEVNKISLFLKENHQQIFYSLIKNNLLCVRDDVEDFAFSNAVTQRDRIKALELSNKIKTSGDVIGQLTLVYNNLRKQLLVQGSNSSAEELGIDSKVYYYLLRNKKYSVEELCKILNYISDGINSIKLGLRSGEDVLSLFIINYI